jgi:hypothetical protein
LRFDLSANLLLKKERDIKICTEIETERDTDLLFGSGGHVAVRERRLRLQRHRGASCDDVSMTNCLFSARSLLGLTARDGTFVDIVDRWWCALWFACDCHAAAAR